MVHSVDGAGKGMKFQIVAAVLLVSVVAPGGEAQITHIPTVKELIEACDSGDKETKMQQCDRWFGSTLYWLVEGESSSGYRPPDSPRLCIPLTDDPKQDVVAFEALVLPWLRNHPEVQLKSVFDGMKDATLALYACSK
jgi:hypothetical protein